MPNPQPPAVRGRASPLRPERTRARSPASWHLPRQGLQLRPFGPPGGSLRIAKVPPLQDGGRESPIKAQNPGVLDRRIAPKVLLPGRGLKERQKHTLRQK